MSLVRIEGLAKVQDRSSFDCGKPTYNDYLKKLARQHQSLGFAQTFVAIAGENPQVLGYISLAMGSVRLRDADPDVIAKMPKHPIPVLHVARLATSLEFAGRGIGALLLSHAADLAKVAAEYMGVYALELIADDEAAYQYYLKRGFLPLKGGSMHLYAPISTIRLARKRA